MFFRENPAPLPSRSAHRTCVLINEVDWEFVKKKRFKPTALLRSKIKELMADDGQATDWRKASAKLNRRLEKICDAMGDVLTEEQFEKVMEKA